MDDLQKPQKKENAKEENLDRVFNPAKFRTTYYNEFPDWREKRDKEKKEIEENLYNEVIEGLESDLKMLGMELTYSAKIIIREIAQNMILLGRTKGLIICSGILETKFEFKKTNTFYRTNYEFKRDSKTENYEQLHNGREVDPVIRDYLPRLHKNINEGLKQLALLPIQQIERQKLTVIKKLKQTCKSIEKEYILKAEKKINQFTKV